VSESVVTIAESRQKTTVDVCVEAIRGMLLHGVLLPGEHIRQIQMATDLGVSRVPVREALAKLAEERVIVHTPDLGYTVARLDMNDLHEIYLMRRVLETELLKATRAQISAEDVATMKAHNQAMRDADAETDILSFQLHNRDFHAVLFDVAGLEIVKAEVMRLWNMVGSYQPLYIYDRGARLRVLDEHDRIIELSRKGDLKALIKIADEHREAAVVKLGEVLHAKEGGRILPAIHKRS
jgi:DNA-binding GntR family transcriptional regulator